MKFKKPKFWDDRNPNILSIILSPLSLLFKINNIFKSKNKFRLDGIQSICVGNIYVGGTGKTSLAIEIKKILDTDGKSVGI